MISTTSMLFIISFFSTALASPISVAPGTVIPIQKRVSSTSRSARAIASQVQQLQAKHERNFNTFKANTGKTHPLASSTPSKRDLYSVGLPLDDFENGYWFGDVEIGTPPVTFTINFDTGSSDLFIPSSECINCGPLNTFDPSGSDTLLDLERSFFVSYGDGSTANGDLVEDVVSISGLTATSQTFGLATNVSASFATNHYDGLMGLAFQSISTSNSTPVFQTLIDQDKVAEGVFSFYLAENNSEIYFGGVNQDKFEGEMNWVTLTLEGGWQIPLDSICVDGVPIIAGPVDSVIDSGTALIQGSLDAVQAFYAAIPGSKNATTIDPTLQGLFTVPCDSTFPEITLTFGGLVYTIEEKYFNSGPITEGSSDCLGGFSASTSNKPFWVVGDVFMRSVYTAFDVTNSRVGFAPLR
ncbi:hypothetical protein BOTBODRAFT_179203 [Botryobasidium botryosum FD-172 SS1]|uniref:Peptidase A1 domain-containing protein n=1 Tax=Botryobasidium botryosum (strain FD-172 SS1) TaxID=930990 RepID=A0A067MBC9_BOTB1|nr:hypothetical protein BOTBODRAFT_179203 [Botryobasidium botryosum FD-172 SS1]